MSYALSRALIETVIRKGIKDIKESPDRSIRNLIDMGLNFSGGRFQKDFFTAAQTMLQNENSAYYRFIADRVAHTDTEKIVTLGLNIGCNSCTMGADRIRELEKICGFNIPWSVSFTVTDFEHHREDYTSLVRQGEKLGIYNWVIYSDDCINNLIEFADGFKDCSFILCCRPGDITPCVTDEAENVNNIMFAVYHSDGVENACSMLRAAGFVYAVLHIYGENDLQAILNGEFICDTDVLYPSFTGFIADKSCSEKTRQTVYQYITETRSSQRYATVLWDMINDSRFVDSIISDDYCSVWFDGDGYMMSDNDADKDSICNIFRQPLKEILAASFPK